MRQTLRGLLSPALLASSLLAAVVPSVALAGQAPEPPAVAPVDCATLPPPSRPMPGWLKGAVLYGVVPPLFGAERPLDAVTARLDALKAQGVDVLWLSPVQRTDDPSAISYAITDYLHVREDFGTAEDLKALVREAHARGLHVILDFVPNHTSEAHPFFRDAQEKGRASPYWGYYQRDEKGESVHYWSWSNLKNLDYDSPAVQQMVTDAFTHWVREYDVDGFRVDAAWGPQLRNPAFWGRMTAALRRVKPDLFLLAEASARDPFFVRNGFDAVYDWTEKLGRWSWEHAFDVPAQTGARLAEALRTCQTPPDRVLRFLNNNDTGKRFVSRHGPRTTRVATVLVHTLPGLPLVYTGDEVGAEFHPYDDPPPVQWNRDRYGLRLLHRRLAELREQLPALHSGGFTVVPVEGAPSALAYLRDAGGREQALVVLQFGRTQRALTLEVPEAFRAHADAGALKDALSGRAVPLKSLGGGRYRLTPPPQSALLLTPT